jgi:hypothetical protein
MNNANLTAIMMVVKDALFINNVNIAKPDASRDDAAVALEAVLAGRAHAEHAREVSRDGRLFCHDQLHPVSLPSGGVIEPGGGVSGTGGRILRCARR